MKNLLYILVVFNFLYANPELVIGEERVEPGVVFIFEGAIKDHVMPMGMHLDEDQTHVHIEARVNWDDKNIPEGTPAFGFVPYLHVTAIVKNQRTGLQTFIDLTPHINLPPTHIDLAMHKDWLDTYGEKLMSGCNFSYKDVYFGTICRATRN